jgi:hypothetical protein
LDAIGFLIDMLLSGAEDSEAAMWYLQGLRVTRSSATSPYWIVEGAAQARRDAGFLANVTRMLGTNERLAGFNTSPAGMLGGAADAIKSPWTVAGVGVAVGLDVFDYTVGPNADFGLDSPEFAAAATTDIIANVLSTGIGGAVAGSVGGPGGMAVGFAAAVMLNGGYNFLARDKVHALATDVFEVIGQFVSSGGYAVQAGEKTYQVTPKPFSSQCSMGLCGMWDYYSVIEK